MKSSQCCGTCMFMDKQGIVGQGICRHGPPTAVVLPKPGVVRGTVDIAKMSFYPPVKIDDRGCGEYKPKLEVVEATEEE